MDVTLQATCEWSLSGMKPGSHKNMLRMLHWLASFCTSNLTRLECFIVTSSRMSSSFFYANYHFLFNTKSCRYTRKKTHLRLSSLVEIKIKKHLAASVWLARWCQSRVMWNKKGVNKMRQLKPSINRVGYLTYIQIMII